MKKIIAGLFIVVALLTACLFGVMHFFPEQVVEMIGNSQRGKANLEVKSVNVGECG